MDSSIPMVLPTLVWEQPQGPYLYLSQRGLPSQLCRGAGNGIRSSSSGSLQASVECREEPPLALFYLVSLSLSALLLCSDIYQLEKDITIEQERNARYRLPQILEPVAFQEPPPKVSQALASLVS